MRMRKSSASRTASTRASRVPPALTGIKPGVAALVLSVTLLASACGGDGGGDELSAAEFRQQADAICEEFEGKLDAVQPPTSPDDLERFVNEAVPIIEEGTNELNALDPPDEFQDEWDRVVEINEENLETIRGVRTALQDNDLAEAQRLMQEAGGNEEEADRLARDIGLTKCGQDTA
jgi:hypothetical protein